jgi:hypothetical protein
LRGDARFQKLCEEKKPWTREISSPS